MSRWNDAFQNHAFQQYWIALKEIIQNENVDDSTVLTSVVELARLKKVITYIDEILKGIDSELVPLSLWDTFHSQLVACHQQVSNYHSNRNIAHIQSANAHADNLLSYVKPYMIAPKSVGNVLTQAVKNYAKTIDEYGEGFRKSSAEVLREIKAYEEQSKEAFESINTTKGLVSDLNIEMFGQNNDGIQEQVRELLIDFKQKNKELTTLYEEMLEGDEDNPSIKKQITEAKENISSDKDDIQILMKKTTGVVTELNIFYEKIFGTVNSKGVLEGGLSQELDLKNKALDAFEEKQVLKYNTINDQIESLLPGATSAGLATAYLDMKVSFNQPIKNASNVFYIAIAVLVLASVLLAVSSVGKWYITFVEFNDWNTVLKGLIYKIPFYAPILWLAYYASKRRSEYQRLQQEYAHKEALAKSYDSYKKQIVDLDGDDMAMQKAFITKAIDAIAYNASVTLDGKHGDNMPSQDLIEKVIGDLGKFRDIFR